LKISILVKPRSKESKIVSYDGKFLTVKVAAIPHKGASNVELIRVLSDFFDISTTKIAIVSGFKSKIKSVEIDGSENNLNLVLKKLL
tara:strand:- start:1863 stop:2123 length:261 start_codon:yes stop_codon:yes gene_type:complete